MNRFEHLKGSRKAVPLEQFIEGAEKLPKQNELKKHPRKEDILLSISGKINRENCTKPKLLFLRKELESEIDKHCVGSKQAILNYLIEEGLASLRQKGEMKIEVLS